MTPYIWRKHLDFAAIHDIHSIKRQIDAPSRRRHGQGSRPQREARPRRHPRNRILRPYPAAHLRGPQPTLRLAPPAPPDARSPPPATSRAKAADELIESLWFPARGRASPADDRRPAYPFDPARRSGRRRRRDVFSATTLQSGLPAGDARDLAARRKPLCQPVRGGGRALAGPAAISSSPAPTTIRGRWRP